MGLRGDYPKRIGPTTLTNSAVALFTAPERVLLTDYRFSNFDTNPHTVSLYIVPAGGNAGNSNAIIASRNVTPQDVYEASQECLVLEQGERLMVSADANSVVNFTATVTNQEQGNR